MTSEELNAKIAIFASRETAQQAANGAMRRRKHNRPYVQPKVAIDTTQAIRHKCTRIAWVGFGGQDFVTLGGF